MFGAAPPAAEAIANPSSPSMKRRGQSNVHDGRIQHDHDLGDDDDAESHPTLLTVGSVWGDQLRLDGLRGR